MPTQQSKIDALLFKLIYILVAGIIIAQPLGLGELTSNLFILTFPLTVLLWLRSVRKFMSGMDLLALCIIVFAFVAVLLNALFSGTDLSFDYLKKVIMFSMSVLFFQTATNIRIDRSVLVFVNRLVDVITVVLAVFYFTDYAQMHLLNGHITQYLTFRFSNPNLTGLFLTCLYMLELYRLFLRERWVWKIIHIAMSVLLAWFILGTRSRNCILVVVLFTAVCVWLVFRSRRKLGVGRGWSFVIATFPAIFLFGYMALISNKWIQNVLNFAVSEGKELNSRYAIWTRNLQYVWNSPLIGDYHEISDGTGMSQLHNTHLDIAGSYGIPVLIMVCILLGNCLYQKGWRYRDRGNYIYILGFACAIMLGIGEAALFSGGLGIYIFAGTFLLFASQERMMENEG